MNASDHRAAAEDIERANADLGDPAAKPYIRRTMIENYFGSAFSWIAYGTSTKHGQHKENHSGLVSYLAVLVSRRLAAVGRRLRICEMVAGTARSTICSTSVRQRPHGRRFGNGHSAN